MDSDATQSSGTPGPGDRRTSSAGVLRAACRQYGAAVDQRDAVAAYLRELSDGANQDAEAINAVLSHASADEALPDEMREWLGDLSAQNPSLTTGPGSWTDGPAEVIPELELYREALPGHVLALARTIRDHYAVLDQDTRELHARHSPDPYVAVPPGAVAIPADAASDLGVALAVLDESISALVAPWRANQAELADVVTAATRRAGAFAGAAAHDSSLSDLDEDQASALGQRVTVGSGHDRHTYQLVDVAVHAISRSPGVVVHSNVITRVRAAVVEVINDPVDRSKQTMVAIELGPRSRRGFWLAWAGDRAGDAVDTSWVRTLVPPASPRAKVAFCDHEAEVAAVLAGEVGRATATVTASLPGQGRHL